MKILVIFVEPMLYGMDLIHEVYERTDYEYRYIYCNRTLTGKDNLEIPDNSFICSGTKGNRRGQIRRELDVFKPDLVVINGYVGVEQTTAIRYCQRHHIKYAIESDTPLHIPENKGKALLKKCYLGLLLKNKYCYGFPGGTLQKENLVYYGIPEDKNYIMPMSVSMERILTAANGFPSKEELKMETNLNNKKVFLFVGRLAPEKNVKLLLEAYKALKKIHSEVALLIVGDGPEASSLKQFVENENIKDVRFCGYVVFPEIVKYYKMSDVFVLPSTYEPWGLVVNEALTMGLPVIVSDRVGCRLDLVTEFENGIIFESGNLTSLISVMKRTVRDLECSFSEVSMSVCGFNDYNKRFTQSVTDIFHG